MKSKDIKGPWSKPVYLHSSGFDASILHDDDGKKYIVSLEWETREGYENQDLSVLLSMIQKKKRLLDIQNHFGEAEQTGDVLRRRI